MALISYLKNLVGNLSAGGLDFDGVASFFALQGFADGGFHADAALERVDFLVADDAVNLFAFGLLVDHLDGGAKANGTVLGGGVFDNLCAIQNAVEFAQAVVDFAHAHTAVCVGGVFAAVAFGSGGLDLVNHCRSFYIFEMFPFRLEFFKAIFRNQVFHAVQFKKFAVYGLQHQKTLIVILRGLPRKILLLIGSFTGSFASAQDDT